jgi:hypothetical protein
MQLNKLGAVIRVSLYCPFFYFRFEAKWCKTYLVSLHFRLFQQPTKFFSARFHIVSLQFFWLFRFNLFASKQKNTFFVILLLPLRFKTFFSLFRSEFFALKHFIAISLRFGFGYFASTFSLQNTFRYFASTVLLQNTFVATLLWHFCFNTLISPFCLVSKQHNCFNWIRFLKAFKAGDASF